MLARSVLIVLCALLAASLACSLVTENTVTSDRRLVRPERPAVVVLAPVNGSIFANGARVSFHVLAHDLGIGVARVEVIIELAGDEILLEHTADPPQKDLEAVLTWTATGGQTALVSVRAFRPNGDPNDRLDDIPSNEVLLSLKVVPPPANIPSDLSNNGDSATPAIDTEALTAYPGTVIGALPAPVRQGPGTSYPLVQDLSPGATVQIVGRSTDSVWLVVRLENGFGWIFRDTIDLSTDVTTLPVVQTPPR